MDFDSLPEDPAQAQAALVPAVAQPAQAGAAPTGASVSSAPSFDELPDDSETKGTNTEQFITGLEGVARGALSAPVATGIEQTLSSMGVPDLTNADINARAQQNPGILAANEAAGLIASSMVPVVGQGWLAARAASAVNEAVNAGKIGSTIIKGLVPALGITGGDEISNAMLGRQDPESPVASSLIRMGANGVLGAASEGVFTGAATGLKSLAASEMGERASQAVADFSSQWKILSGEKSLLDSVYNEVGGMFGTIKESLGDIHTTNGVKDQVIDKLAPTVDPLKAQQHVAKIAEALDNASLHLKDDPTFQDAGDRWKFAVGIQNAPTGAELQANRFFNSPNITGLPKPISNVGLNTPGSALPSLSDIEYTPAQPPLPPMEPQPIQAPEQVGAGDIFKATDNLKKDLGDLLSFGTDQPDRSDLPFLNAGNKFYGVLANSLEDTNTWGKLGQFQKDYNAAFSEFKPYLDEFTKTFTKPIGGNLAVDYGKINNFVNNSIAGKPSADTPSQYIENFVTHGQNLMKEMNSLWKEIGIEKPFNNIPISATKAVMGESTTGTRLANTLYNPFGASKMGSHIAGAIVGGAGAQHFGLGLPGELVFGAIGSALAPIMEEITGRIGNVTTRKAIVPIALKALGSGAADKIFTAIDHANNAYSGLQMTNNAVDGLFKAASSQVINYSKLSKDRERTKDFIQSGGIDQQIQNQQTDQNQPTPVPTLPWQTFAEGGMVEAPIAPAMPAPKPKDQEKLAPVLEGTKGFSQIFPEQNVMMQSARARIGSYLKNQAPQPNLLKLPFDHDMPDQHKNRDYDKLIDLANNPIQILDDVKKGVLTPQTLKHFVSMYPEVHSFLSKKIFERITQAQLDDDAPKYNTRQAMAMFLGQPLDSSMTPQSIQATQAVYAQQGASQPQPQGKTKRNTSKMGKIAENTLTPDQGREQRAMKT